MTFQTLQALEWISAHPVSAAQLNLADTLQRSGRTAIGSRDRITVVGAIRRLRQFLLRGSARAESYRFGGLEIEDETKALRLLRPFRRLCRDEAPRQETLKLIGVTRGVIGDNSCLPNYGRGLYFESEDRCIECRISLRHSTAGAPL
jgi:hypothetical protein